MTGSYQSQITISQDTIRGVCWGFSTTMIIQSDLKFSVYLMDLSKFLMSSFPCLKAILPWWQECVVTDCTVSAFSKQWEINVANVFSCGWSIRLCMPPPFSGAFLTITNLFSDPLTDMPRVLSLVILDPPKLIITTMGVLQNTEIALLWLKGSSSPCCQYLKSVSL